MELCSCSPRPLGIINSRVEMQSQIPYQILDFACTNKKCNEYKEIVYSQAINLLDNSDTYTTKLK